MSAAVPDPSEREVLREEDELLAGLVGDYVQRRETARTPAVHDLLACAAEFGHKTETRLRVVLAFYEAMRARELE
jgi:hypothetical protein